jgi:MipA family protein
MRIRNSAALAAALGALLAGTAAFAQSGRPPAGDTVTVGLGVGVSPSYEGADEYKLIPGGILRGTVAGHDFFLGGLQLNIDAIPNGAVKDIDLSLGPVVGVRLNRNGRVKDARVAALGELNAAVELGGFAAIGTANGFTSRNDSLALRVSYVRDVANAHKSHLITPSIEYSRRFGMRTFSTIALSAEFAGDRYASYYFDVSPAQSAASGLRPFAAKGGLKSLGGNLLLVYSLSDRPKGWSLFGIASYSRLQGDFARSPVVADAGSANQAFGALGVGYTF